MVALAELSTKQRTYAGVIYGVAVERFGADAALAAVYGIACSGAEASLVNWENAGTSTHVGRAEGRQLNASERAVARRSLGLGDGAPPWGDNLDSMGLFAQRPMSGWGAPEQIMRPVYAAGKFFDGLAKIPGWSTRPAADVIAKVQGYYDPTVYEAWMTVARQLVDSLTPTPNAAPIRKDDIMATAEDLEKSLDKLAEKTAKAVQADGASRLDLANKVADVLSGAQNADKAAAFWSSVYAQDALNQAFDRNLHKIVDALRDAK